MTSLEAGHNLWGCFPLFLYKYPFGLHLKGSLFLCALVTDETGEEHWGASPLKHAEL